MCIPEMPSSGVVSFGSFQPVYIKMLKIYSNQMCETHAEYVRLGTSDTHIFLVTKYSFYASVSMILNCDVNHIVNSSVTPLKD